LQLFAEGYSSLLPNQPVDNKRPAFYYSYAKANRAGVNLALAMMLYSSKRFRTNLGVMAGDYPKANLAAEQPWARNIYELNAGFKPLQNHELWIDTGVLPSHIGLESAIGKDNTAVTRSILADDSPYYETGVRMSYKPNNQWYAAIFTLTG
jgi:hypothetical protein